MWHIFLCLSQHFVSFHIHFRAINLSIRHLPCQRSARQDFFHKSALRELLFSPIIVPNNISWFMKNITQCQSVVYLTTFSCWKLPYVLILNHLLSFPRLRRRRLYIRYQSCRDTCVHCIWLLHRAWCHARISVQGCGNSIALVAAGLRLAIYITWQLIARLHISIANAPEIP